MHFLSLHNTGRLGAAALVILLTACGPATLPPGDQIADADEARNRAAHATNIALDRAVLDPAATAYGTAVPEPLRVGVSNFASNLNQPGYVVNNLLQLRLGDAAQNTLRFALNSTLGVAGLFDVASALGLPEEETDFGETLHIYGVGEGDYVVHPVFGPSTTRDTVGMVVDFAMNPLRHYVDTPESYYSTGASIASGLNSRYEFGDTVDSILYESADSYAQMRSLYLQQRRFELGGADAAYEDPYVNDDPAAAAEAVAADPNYDPYSDPYFDPYAQ
ncbi:VacJ family lipoprotein [Rhodobacteraceae bacterium N5(2021)]|uniref:VacJ family lipoprotein n=1 Tax=Gymnodinialimonas phycosphaerae TaxID=2841589 RepID=A0A975YFB2_9RHOB|nr:VacJ family lipoprotein [Gymnodinialimonas phycosphaerae]